jgi:hypothetical protein
MQMGIKCKANNWCQESVCLHTPKKKKIITKKCYYIYFYIIIIIINIYILHNTTLPSGAGKKPFQKMAEQRSK